MFRECLGQNFMGEIYRVLYKNNETNDNPTSLILKLAPTNRVDEEKKRSRIMFLREMLMYSQVGLDNSGLCQYEFIDKM